LSFTRCSLIAVLLLAILASTLPLLNVSAAGDETNIYNTYRVQLEQEVFAKVNYRFYYPQSVGGSVEFKGISSINLNVTSERIEGYIVLNCKDLKAHVYATQNGYTITSPIDTSSYCTRYESRVARSTAEYLSGFDPRESLNELLSYAQSVLSSQGFSVDFLGARVDFNGIMYYKGYPVMVYTIKLKTEFSVSGYRFEMDMSGKDYVYAGIPISLYSTVSGSMHVYDSSGKLVFKLSLEALLETNRLDLPSGVPRAYSDQGDFVVVAGGLPGARIIVKGVKGERKLTVVNNGTDTGYVSIIYRSTGGSVLAFVPLAASGSSIENYAIKPGEVKEIPLRVALKSDLEVKAYPSLLTGFAAVAVFTAILVVVFGALVAALYWLLKPVRSKT